jgi:hypothetical protein
MTTATSIELYANFASTTLASGINNSATSLTVATGTGSQFPNPGANQYFRITLNDASTGLVYETMYVTARSGDTLSGLVRGQEGTTAVAWLASDKVYEAPSAGAMANLTQQFQTQTNSLKYVADTGSANAYNIAPLPANLTTPVAGAILYFLAANANTGASTIVVNGSSTYPLLGITRVALQGGEIQKFCAITYDTALSSYILLWSTGGNVPVASPTKSLHAVNLAYANATYAALNGNAAVAFSAAEIATSVIANTTGVNSGTVLLQSSSYVAAVNLADTAYVPIYCANPTTGQAAVNLQYANAAYAALNGSFAQSFDVANLYTNGGALLQLSGGYMVVDANAGLYVENIAGNALTPVTCGPATNTLQAVVLGQLSNPQIGGTEIFANNTTVTINLAFTAFVTGVLFVTMSTVYSNVSGGTPATANNSTLYINGVNVAADSTNLTRTEVAVGIVSPGVNTIEAVGAAQVAFSLWCSFIFVPNLR